MMDHKTMAGVLEKLHAIFGTNNWTLDYNKFYNSYAITKFATAPLLVLLIHIILSSFRLRSH